MVPDDVARLLLTHCGDKVQEWLLEFRVNPRSLSNNIANYLRNSVGNGFALCQTSENRALAEGANVAFEIAKLASDRVSPEMVANSLINLRS